MKGRARRSKFDTGFSLAEVIVAVAIASATLLLLSGTSIGLKAVALQSTASQSDILDLARSRRLVGSWLSQISTRTHNGGPIFYGDDRQLKFQFEEAIGQLREFQIRLRLDGEGPHWYLIVERTTTNGSTEFSRSRTRTSVLFESVSPLRFGYRFEKGDPRWLREVSPERGLPDLIGVLRDENIVLLWKLDAAIDADCLRSDGKLAIRGRRCSLR